MLSNKLPASINLVIRNEENRLKKLLPILHEHFDEIVVVDQESTDNSLEIAAKYTNKVFSDTPTGYPESSRALAAEQSKNDWVFIIDADEIPNIRLFKDLPGILKKDIECVLFHYGVFHYTESIVDYDKIMRYREDTEDLKIRIAPMIFRIIKKENLICNPFLHQGIEMKHNTLCHYLKYHGIFHHKTESDSIRVKERYSAVSKNLYDKDIHI